MIIKFFVFPEEFLTTNSKSFIFAKSSDLANYILS